MGALTSKFRQATYNIIKDQKTKEYKNLVCEREI